jgi:hypothetical protein
MIKYSEIIELLEGELAKSDDPKYKKKLPLERDTLVKVCKFDQVLSVDEFLSVLEFLDLTIVYESAIRRANESRNDIAARERRKDAALRGCELLINAAYSESD